MRQTKILIDGIILLDNGYRMILFNYIYNMKF